MKSYTDIEQSKKLVEILPLESADMHYCLEQRDIASGYEIGITPYTKAKSFTGKCNIIDVQPSWSLAALFSVIPQEIFGGEYIINITEGIDNRWALTYDHFENRNHSYYSLSIGADNLVDACVSMIEKLHELNLL